MSGNYIKNVVHDSGHIYLDQGSTGWTMTNNVATGGTTWLRHNPNSFDPASNFVPHEYTDLNYASTATTKITGLSYVPTGELPASIINAAGLEPAFKDLHLVTPTGDTQAPTAPKQLKATITNPTAVNFSWFGSADNVVVTGYEVHVNDALALVTVTPGATLTGLVPGRPTTLTVYARDLAGNLSNPASITVKLPPADTQPPTAPGTPTISAPYPTTVHLSWSASTDNWAVTQYLVYRDGTLAATTTGTATDVYGATPGQAAQYTVKAEDAMGNISAAGPAVSATTPNMPNLAYHVPAQALFLDGSTAAMQANSVPGYAVDGDLSTYVQATNQYAWQLQIDLGASHDISSVVTTMPSDKFATEYKIEVSADGQNWTVGDDVTGFMGGVSTQNFANPASGRYLRIVAVKPDGGGQTGGQMAISELAVYGS
jgi:chitodextrinase